MILRAAAAWPSAPTCIIAEVAAGRLLEAGLPREVVAVLGSDRAELRQLLQMERRPSTWSSRAAARAEGASRESTRKCR